MAYQGWSVVKFVTEQTVEAVPFTWLLKEDDETYCKWPPSSYSRSQVTNAIKHDVIPDDDWKLHEVEVMSKHIYSDFQNANRKASKAVINSDFESSCNEQSVNQKRIVKPNKRYDDNFSDDDPDDRQGSSDQRQYPVAPKTTSAPLRTADNITEKNDVEDGYNNDHSISYKEGTNPSSNNRTEFERQVMRQLFSMSIRLREVQDCLNILLNHQSTNLTSGPKNVEIAEEPENIYTHLQLPLDSANSVDELEEKLLDSNIQDKLVHTLGKIGGTSTSEIVRRIMTKVISNKLAMEFSYIAGKKKKNFSATKLCSVVKRAVRRNGFVKETDKEIETKIAIWLTKAKERFNRQK